MHADESDVKRFLCSDLVVLSLDGQARFVNLEEIWRTGAMVESEEEAPLAAQAEMRAGNTMLKVSIERVERHEYGYRLELRFEDVEWSPELFTPAHLTDLTTIGKAPQAGAASDANGS